MKCRIRGLRLAEITILLTTNSILFSMLALAMDNTGGNNLLWRYITRITVPSQMTRRDRLQEIQLADFFQDCHTTITNPNFLAVLLECNTP